jgi:hypothetical protein
MAVEKRLILREKNGYLPVLKLRYFSDQSRLAEASLRNLGYPNTFPAEPVVSRDIWKAVQTMDPTCIQCCKVLVGHPSRFSDYVTKVVATEGEFLHDDLKELLFSTKYTLRKIHDTDAKKSSTARFNATDHVMQYMELLRNPSDHGSDVEQVLRVLKSFHVLKRCDPAGYGRWSSSVLFTCSCPQFFKTGSCEHSIITSMIINKAVEHSIITSMIINKAVEVPGNYCVEKPGALKKKKVKDTWEFVWRLHPVKKKNHQRWGMLSLDQPWTSPRRAWCTIGKKLPP